jgi:capsular polysaccharide biosynthesis protein
MPSDPPLDSNCFAGSEAAFSMQLQVVTATVHEWQDLSEQIAVFQRTSVLVYPHGATMAHAIFLPRGAVAVEVIPWPNVTEPHGWLQVRPGPWAS